MSLVHKWLAVAALASTLCWVSAQTAPPVLHEGYVQVPGARIWYVDSGGSGVPVVFVHAATGSSRVWEHQIAPFTSAGYRFIAYDRRGYGRSVIDPAGPQPGTGADDLQNLIEQLGIERFHLVGTAAGGFTALDYALSFPQRLRSLVIANSIGGVSDPDYLQLGRRLRPPQFDTLPPEFREIGPAYRAANPDGTARWMELERTSKAAGAPAPAQTMRNQLTFSQLEGIHIPTLFLTGAADLYAPPPIIEMFTARIKGSTSVIIPEAGHSSYWEKPDLFNAAVLHFIGQNQK